MKNNVRLLSTVVLAIGASAAAAQDFDRIAPREVAPPGRLEAEGARRAPTLDTRPRLEALKGLVFLSDPAAVQPAGIAGAVGVDASRVPELQSEDFRARMAKYLGRPVSAASLDAMVNDVVTWFVERDRPFIVVTAPEQDITSGVIQLLVIEGRVGEIDVVGARLFPESRYRDAIGLKPGDRISKRRLDADLDWLNRNPFREVTTQLQPGRALGTTDIVLRTRERPPLRVYAGFEDTGTELIGRNRFLVGVNWGNAFGLDHQASYQYTASDDLRSFNAHSLTYVVPLPWRHLLTTFASHAEIQGRVPAPFASDGASSQLGLRYEIPLPRHARYSHSVSVGADFKRSNNNLEFGGARVSATTADVVQGLMAYQGALTDGLGSTHVTATLVHSPGGLTDRNSDANFRALRAFAEARYTYGNLKAGRSTRLPGDFTWTLSGEAQVADGNLLGSEQLGAGGYATVRGYDETEATGDEGFLLRSELRTPFYRFGPAVDGRQAQAQLLVFTDYGSVRNRRLLPSEDRDVVLWSAGAGLRFFVDQNVTVRFDYGWQLKDTGSAAGAKNSRAHFSLLISF